LPRRPLLLLAALCAAAATAVPPTAAAAVGDCTPSAAWPANRADLAAQVVDLVNSHRAGLGMQPLVVSPTLTAAATWKARHMAAYDYMDHDDPAPPVARTTGERLADCGYPLAAWGENIAEGYQTAQAVVNGWLGSPGHRANIEDPAYRATGVGAAGSPLYWAQTFGSVVDAGSAVSTSPALVPAPQPGATPSRAASSVAPLRVSCALHGRRVACRVRDQRGAIVHIVLKRRGRMFARARMRAGSNLVRVRLHAMRRLRPGRYALVARAGSGSGAHERRMALMVR
jgi:uncharacterized protein YkwD